MLWYSKNVQAAVLTSGIYTTARTDTKNAMSRVLCDATRDAVDGPATDASLSEKKRGEKRKFQAWS